MDVIEPLRLVHSKKNKQTKNKQNNSANFLLQILLLGVQFYT